MRSIDEAASRLRGRSAGQAAQRAAHAAKVTIRTCTVCGADISHRRKDAWHCGSAVHGQRVWHERGRAKSMAVRAYSRPRCMICDAPLDPRFKGWTCSRECAIKRNNWYKRG